MDAADRRGSRSASADFLALPAAVTLVLVPLVVEVDFVSARDGTTKLTGGGGASYDSFGLGGGSLLDVLGRDRLWGVATVSLVALVALYVAWRRLALSAGRPAGVLLAIGTLATLSTLSRDTGIGLVAWAASAMMLAGAFAVAPPPARNADPGGVTARRLLRRHRERGESR